jgi:glycosyltransferase involved in cell wall biosynthesis
MVSSRRLMPPRFLVLTQYFPPEIGAVPVRIAALVRHLRAGGHEVEVVTGMPNYPGESIFEGYRGRLYMREEVDGVRIHRVWLYAATGSGLRRILNYATFAAMSLIGILRAKRPSYIFVESVPLTVGVAGWLGGLLRRVPTIFNVADLWVEAARDMGVIRSSFVLKLADRLERWLYRKARFVNAVTDGIRDNLVGEKQLPARKVLFLPNGVDTTLFAPRPADAELARELDLTGKAVVLYAGVLGIPQGLEVAIDAFALLGDRAPEALLLFIGAGSEEQKLKQHAASLGLKNVRFLPPRPVEDIARLYSVAFAGYAGLKDLPLFDGFRPSKLMPIMASGKPVLYSGQGEGARLIERAGSGVVVRPGDSAALAAAIESLLQDRSRAAALGAAGRQYVEQHLGWPALLADWVRQLTAAEQEISK